MASPYLHLLAAQARSQLSYRASFALDLFGNVVTLGADLLAVLILFRVTPLLGGFTIAEELLIFALAATAFALADLAVGNIERIRLYVRIGLLDALLVRPLGVLPQLLVVDFGLRRAGRVVYAAVLLAGALVYAQVDWTPGRVALAIVAPISGAVLFSAIFVAGATVAFWWIESGELANALTYGGRDFTAYPVNVYSGWFRRVFAFGAGFAFVAYYPALVLLGRPDPLGLPTGLGWASPAVAGVAAAVAAFVWRTGVRQYRSTGS